MPDHPLKLHELRKILSRFDAHEEPGRGKGSHLLFVRVIDGQSLSYTIPTSKTEISTVYIRGIRKRFRLTKDDGTPDADFYSQ